MPLPYKPHRLQRRPRVLGMQGVLLCLRCHEDAMKGQAQ